PALPVLPAQLLSEASLELRCRAALDPEVGAMAAALALLVVSAALEGSLRSGVRSDAGHVRATEPRGARTGSGADQADQAECGRRPAGGRSRGPRRGRIWADARCSQGRAAATPHSGHCGANVDRVRRGAASSGEAFEATDPIGLADR